MRPRLLLSAMTVLVLGAGCASIHKQTNFFPCEDADCGKCRGHGNYRCTRCLGRGAETCGSCNGDGFYLRFVACHEHRKRRRSSCHGCRRQERRNCSSCSGLRTRSCRKCGGDGMIECGTTTYNWLCRKCGKRFDYPAKLCPDCDKKK